MHRPAVAALVTLLTAPPAARALDAAPRVVLRFAGQVAPSASGLEAWEAMLDPAVLTAATERLELGLAPGRTVTARRVSVETRGPDDLVWRGRLAPGGGAVDLTRSGPRISGLVHALEGVWEIAPLPSGHHRLELLDGGREPPCGGAHAPASGRVPLPATAGRPLAETEIDVLILFTPQALAGAGGPGAIAFVARSAADRANTALLESDVAVRYRLLSATLADHDDSGDTVVDLAWLSSDPGVAALRDALGADLVSLLVEQGEGVCGRSGWGPSPDAVWQVTLRACAVGFLTWAHEHGHNLGMEHDPANGRAPAAASFPWSYGHFVSTSPAPPGGNFRTVMSGTSECAFGCPRVPRHSNPAILYNGEPTGLDDGVCDPADWDPSDPNAWACRDDHRTANLTAPIVAAFRASAVLLVDGFESGDTASWSSTVP